MGFKIGNYHSAQETTLQELLLCLCYSSKSTLVFLKMSWKILASTHHFPLLCEAQKSWPHGVEELNFNLTTWFERFTFLISWIRKTFYLIDNGFKNFSFLHSPMEWPNSQNSNSFEKCSKMFFLSLFTFAILLMWNLGNEMSTNG